ncbi:peptide-methionine (S)-S-oxide reductase MsrA [Mucilaginibacter galii]|uniref:Peptide methionine sulfoxide reductase MsrA n=1 Tax=Mucilaginibacter galii TaxID=2005073 RepID=A0A917N195_9SPHI|nr:peptide-methionine (S)-S-oxide reductase MsrA [Mucilaginibacter galii]GGI50661.1 peptide methionine sulfoxide reductase MsrA [Mucilaginibacter galii]
MSKIKVLAFVLGIALVVNGLTAAKAQSAKIEKATFGMGCFWCSEAIFQRLKGVVKVESGYAGGNYKNPTYEDVCTGNTGHAEVVQVTFEPEVISYKELLEIFWKMHDPTTLNRQGADVGTQYRSIIFYHTPQQKTLAEAYKTELNKEKVYPDPIVTQIAPFSNFYVAENYHQNYFKLNGREPYCRMVILPKVDKLEKVFKAKLKQ